MRCHVLRASMWTLLGLLILLAGVLAAQPAAAQGTCIDDVTGVENVCSANDVELSYLVSAEDTSCMPGELVTLHLIARLVATSQERYDIGMFLALDGGSADTGLCQHDYLPPPLAAGGTCSVSGDDCKKDADCDTGETCTGGYDPGTLDDPGGPFYDAEPQDMPDECGDLEQGVDNYYLLAPIQVECIDTDGDGYLDIGTAVSWDNKKDNTCENVDDAVPNTKAKCRYGTVNVRNVIVFPGDIQLQKSPEPPQVLEPGGWVTFTFSVENTSQAIVTLESLLDSVYGRLEDANGNCLVPQTLDPGETYVCSIGAEVTGAPGIYEDTVLALGRDPNQATVSDTARAEVLLVGLAPALSVTKAAAPTTIMEPGGEILYTISVANNSGDSDPVRLTSLEDNIYGDLTNAANPAITTSTCMLATILPGQVYTCTFTAQVNGIVGNTIVDTVTATGIDDEGEEAQAADEATVTLVAEPPDTGLGMPAGIAAGGIAVLGLGLLLVGMLVRRRTR